MATRWGIISTGFISADFVTAVQSLPEKDHKVVAVAARNLENAKQFADRFNIPKSYGSYEELVRDPNIDVVYIGSIHTHHHRQSKMALEAGKPVLCEKPMAMNTREVEEVLTLAKQKKLYFQEGFWSRFFPVYEKLRTSLTDGTIGEVRHAVIMFGFPLTNAKRISDLKLGGGALMDVGCYTVQMAELIFGGKPEKIVATGTLMPTGADDTDSITLHFSGGRIAVLTLSVTTTLSQKVLIHGTKGIIEIPGFMWCPIDIIVNGEKYRYPLPECSQPFNFHHGTGFTYEAQHVRERLLNGDLESPLISHESSRNIAKILEGARKQLGVVYDADKE